MYRIDPWGEERADWRTAQQCWMAYQMGRAKGSDDKSIADFLPDFDGERGEAELPTAEQLKAKLMGMTAAVGGRITTAGEGGAASG